MPTQIGGNWNDTAASDGYIILFVEWLDPGLDPFLRRLHVSLKVASGHEPADVQTTFANEWPKLVGAAGTPKMSSNGGAFTLTDLPDQGAGYPKLKSVILDTDGTQKEVEVTMSGPYVGTLVSGLTIRRTL